ncbi:MAG TPA: 4-(cytidine 5'-diphospho)-2-C-methyl-D-erythritol kinase [Gemmatimonadaceae bacterium]|nr:4-(cytidine 5'-diphospho)-2-C-methyl-D-erythritol kinase [Gemmatimonadaceae bacterium]
MSGPSARIQAQAKINLHLRILTKEESGFHSLETIYHRIEHADELKICIEPDRRKVLDVQGADLGPVESNLAYRAVLAYSDACRWPWGFTMELDKNIPVGAGLGGGSADAAAVLRALDSLNRQPAGERRLLAIAASLGADVPFLVSSEVMALAWGRGERMLGLVPLPQRDVILVTPDFQIATADAYSWLDAGRPSEGETGQSASDLLLISDQMLASWKSVGKLNRNDFIAPVADRYPQIRTHLENLKGTGSFFCSMTGSGSTLFGVYEALPEAPALKVFEGATLTPTRTATSVVQPVRIG